ncbi:hypothetical protein [Thiomicrospira sp. ALE5]|uniref:hypothetical protein n=1 Tax=Thiomicrospira sp. ALE5 TaxID=748650 RepID=UPI000B24A6D6|nr:hypothetical protein [Thiomicrospira sp. ALE5]
MAWQRVYTKQAQKDAKKLAGSGLKKQAIHRLGAVIHYSGKTYCKSSSQLQR